MANNMANNGLRTIIFKYNIQKASYIFDSGTNYLQ